MSAAASRSASVVDAQRVFWGLLFLSMVFNALVGLLEPGETHPAVAVVVHAAFPAMFAVSEYLLVRVRKLRSKVANFLRVVFATGSALAAVAGSAENLAHLGELVGLGEYMRWALPMAIDFPAFVAMLSTVFADSQDEPVVATEPAVAVKPVPPRPISAPNRSGSPGVSRPVRKRSKGRGGLTPEKAAEVLSGAGDRSMSVLAEELGCSVRTLRRHKAAAIDKGLLQS